MGRIFILMLFLNHVNVFGQTYNIHKFESERVIITNPNNSNDKSVLDKYSLITIDFNKSMISISPTNATLDIVGDGQTIHTGSDEIVTYICKDEKNEDCKVFLYYKANRIAIIQLTYSSIELVYIITKERD